jgi:hypothetical protein
MLLARFVMTLYPCATLPSVVGFSTRNGRYIWVSPAKLIALGSGDTVVGFHAATVA